MWTYWGNQPFPWAAARAVHGRPEHTRAFSWCHVPQLRPVLRTETEMSEMLCSSWAGHSKQAAWKEKYSLCNSVRNEKLLSPPATAPVSDNSAPSQGGPEFDGEVNFLFYSSPIQGWGLEGIQRLDGNKILTVHRVKFIQTFPWKQLGREVLTQACERPRTEMNKMQLCPVAKSPLGLPHFVSLAILHDNSIIWQVLILKSIYLNDLLCSGDERAALQIKDYSSFCKSNEWNFWRIDKYIFPILLSATTWN